MEYIARFFVTRTFIVQFFAVLALAFANTEFQEKPKADKLTIDIDSVQPRLPPQIAYFIPDQFFNRTIFGQNQPPLINMWPQNDPRNQTLEDFNVTDLMMSQQREHRYVAVPKSQLQSFVDDDPPTAYQNFNYQIDFAKIPDKEPDFTRFESLNRERDAVKRGKSKKYNKRPVSVNYANTLPNIRSRIKHIKINHENKFEVSKDKHSSDSGSGSGSYSDELDNYTSDRSKVHKNGLKFKKSRRNKPHYSRIKLSHPISSVENESSSNYDTANIDENDNYHFQHLNHKNCNHPNSDFTEIPENYYGSENEHLNYDDTEYQVPKRPSKGFKIYLTKIIKHPKPRRSLRMDKTRVSKNGFVPTRIMASIRGEKKVVHKPRKMHKPTVRERFRESGGHIVYTEDGYEDEEYDHDTEDKSLEYISRKRRSANVKDLKGQQLIDHLDSLIRNVSDYLNSSEIIPDTTHKKYPLYNSTDKNIKDSPIKYSEFAKPVVDEDYSSELYESKVENCDEIDDEKVDLSNAHNDTSGPKKRLGNLNNKLDCLKKKFFGENPLNNPLFQEDKVSQPQSDNLFTSAMQEAESIQTISSVYSDVMDNIKYNSFNENQRIFSDYGVSDNFAVGSYNSKPAVAKPENELNTNEKYPDDYAGKINTKRIPAVTQSPLIFFNPFRDPAQLPMLDITKYIPTPSYAATESDSDIPLQTDFVPIVSPYVTNYKPSVRSTTTTIAPITQTQTKYGTIHGQTLRKVPSYYINQNSHISRNPTQNILLLKHRRPVAVVRIIPQNPLGPRNMM